MVHYLRYGYQGERGSDREGGEGPRQVPGPQLWLPPPCDVVMIARRGETGTRAYKT